jgi:hypothetical protein
MSLPLCVKNVIIQQSQFVVNCLVRPEEFESPTSRLRRPVFYPVELETHCMALVGGIEPPMACADRVPITLQPGLNWCHELDSNQPHTDFQSAALPDELPRQKRKSSDLTRLGRVWTCSWCSYQVSILGFYITNVV